MLAHGDELGCGSVTHALQLPPWGLPPHSAPGALSCSGAARGKEEETRFEWTGGKTAD